MKSRLALVRVRGEAKVPRKIKDTLQFLRLYRTNYCALVDDSPVARGMVHKVKDYITWGELSNDVMQKLIAERGREYKGRLQDVKKKYSYRLLKTAGENAGGASYKHYKPYFCLNPPRKGFGRKGIKVAFAVGGALGYRGEKINDLILRML